jgi:hypothetical protein
MMRTTGMLVLAGCLALLAGGAEAEGPKLETTADLIAYCDNVGPVGEVRDGQNFCDGFIMGSGLLYLELVAAGKMKQVACAEPIPTVAQAREDLVAWATSHPEQLKSKPIDGLWRAMAATYPCPK